MSKIALITGSETFGRYLTSSTKWLALSAEGKVIADHKISILIFPSVTHLPEDAECPGRTIVKKALDIKADVILSFGMASAVKGFRIERSASNWTHNDQYCQPHENKRPIDPDRPPKEVLHTDMKYWDQEKIGELFREAKVPFDEKISDDPGNYSCNNWIYRTLQALKQLQVPIPYLFVHMACIKEAVECISDFPHDQKTLIQKEDTLKALEIFLQSYS